MVKVRRQRLLIQKIKNEEEEWLTFMEDISKGGVNAFQQHLTPDHSSTGDELLCNIPCLVSQLQNDSLIAFPSLDELHNVVNSMDENSIAGSDGYNGYFYKHRWDIIKENFQTAICEFFAGFELPKCWTSTLLVPIPKTTAPTYFSQFKPISLQFC